MSMSRQFAVFRQPGHVFIGIEPASFNVIQLAEKYGSGEFQISLFENRKEIRRYNQVVAPNFGPPKKVDPLPNSELPGALNT